RKYQIPAVEVVPGDIVEIEAGQKIIADLRLIQGQNLRINESSLTGESIPVGKVVDAKLPEKTPLGDRKNLLFMGTLAAYGKGIGVVVNTGLNTEIGKIANLVTKAESLDTPLQSRLEKFSSQLGLGTILIAFLMILLGFSLEFASNSEFDVAQTLVDLVIIGVSLAVAAIPEGLPAVLTLTLAIGVQRMAKRNAICRTLEAVEALGSTTFICTDKTGTLTQNVMSATSFATEGCFYHLEDPMELLVGFKSDFALQDIISVSRLVNTTTLKTSREGSSGYDGVLGDPLDQALFKNVRALQKLVQTQCTDWQKFSELPFDSERKLMSAVVITHDPEYLLLTKGAPDVLFSRCNRLKKSDGSNVALTDEFLAKLNEDLEKFSMEGLRVIGCAIRPINEALAMKTREDHFDMGMLETEMIFVGFIGLMDPPRPEVPKSIEACKAAGIKVAMITGDHPNTALAIARSIGIVESHQSRIIKGSELDSMSDGQLKEELGEVRIFARVDPESKMRIVNQL
ncbi:MAG TPA: HAD-IC family P-type ATPase, partial [Candidatus Hodarchaeales archaeon]|nr:HAD-IC family P-type ATPase [Candidatus Hodarchaeales archaeon]